MVRLRSCQDSSAQDSHFSNSGMCCSAKDFFRILTEPEHNMIKQQQALIATEGVDLIFTDPAIRRISEVAEEVNTLVDNIGARRLHTILERILEDISFNAPEEVRPGLTHVCWGSEVCFCSTTTAAIITKIQATRSYGEILPVTLCMYMYCDSRNLTMTKGAFMVQLPTKS